MLHSTLGQRVERVAGEVGRGVKHVGLPLLQDVLQQLIQDVPCRRRKGQRLQYVSQTAFRLRVKMGNEDWRHPQHQVSPSSSLSAFQAAGSLSNNGIYTAEADTTPRDLLLENMSQPGDVSREGVKSMGSLSEEEIYPSI